MALVTNTIGTAGDYTTIAAWLAAAPTLGTDIWHGQLIDNKNYNEEVDLTGTDTATATSYLWLDVHPNVRHDGTAGSGARIEITGTAPVQGSVIIIGTDYGRVSGLEIYLGAADASDEAIRMQPNVGGTQDDILIEDCLIWTDTGVADTDGIYATNDNTILSVVNCVFQGWERGAIHMQNGGSERFYTVNVDHCAFIDGMSDTGNGGAFRADAPGTLAEITFNVYNCVSTGVPDDAGGITGEVFAVGGTAGTITWNGSNNLVASSTPGGGTNNMTVDGFNHDAGGTPALTAGSDTFNVGATLNISGSQVPNAYAGTYSLTVNYQ